MDGAQSKPVVPPKLLAVAIVMLVFCVAAIIARYVRFPEHGTPQPKLPTVSMTLAGHHLTVEQATSENQRKQGLAFRPSMAADEGMLFVYPFAAPQNFWTHGMQFPVDVLFLKGDTVVDYEDSVPPPAQTNGEAATETTLEDADSVLVISAGLAKEWNVGIRTKIEMGK